MQFVAMVVVVRTDIYQEWGVAEDNYNNGTLLRKVNGSTVKLGNKELFGHPKIVP